MCESSLRRGHANLLGILPILTSDPLRESPPSSFTRARGLPKGFLDRRTLHQRPKRALRQMGRTWLRTSGVGTNGAAANFMFFGRGNCWVPPFTYFDRPFPKDIGSTRRGPNPESGCTRGPLAQAFLAWAKPSGGHHGLRCTSGLLGRGLYSS